MKSPSPWEVESFRADTSSSNTLPMLAGVEVEVSLTKPRGFERGANSGITQGVQLVLSQLGFAAANLVAQAP
eukprot:CAMPEP_0206608104 /NCGR_PEP_ID=MMETSP0325_2-20121206/52717_1 /ASSEMBLY_ACC=CAM_ASM_000347 /TAXON_ID=2866 /ORGANISM="Crypthecodinium cohnii, Strain Seligo" /LENGTH=71 /DNA_ID=CAMNT_0054125585 /DNA_START=62 /DNA_END=273 /DNA_ORIENTATION=+